MALHFREPDRPSLDQPDPFEDDDDWGLSAVLLTTMALASIGVAAVVFAAMWLIFA